MFRRTSSGSRPYAHAFARVDVLGDLIHEYEPVAA